MVGYYRALNNPLQVQRELLFSILKTNALTQFGVRHNFDKISTLKDFQNLPVVTYEDISSYIDAIASGAKNVLTADDVVSFAVTSGSTSKAKLIPITRFRRSTFFKDLALYGSLNPTILKDKMLYIAGPRKERETAAGIPIGSISGYLVSIQPWFVKKRMVVPVEVYDVLDFNNKLHLLAFYSLQHRNIGHLSFSSCVEAMMLFDYIRENRSTLLSQLKNVVSYYRFRQLSKLPDFIPARIWPRMKNISCVLSAGNRSYIPAFLEKFGRQDIVFRDPGVLASEGRLTLTVKTEDNIAYGIPTVNNYVYEFCEQKSDASFKKPVFIDKVKKGKTYKLLLTSQEGLYRYEMDDLFEISYFEKKLPVMRFVSRTKCLNMAGELAAHENIIAAFEHVRKQMSLSSSVSFLVLPWFKQAGAKPRYDLLTDASFSEAEALECSDLFDKKLMDLIYSYKRMRTFFGRIFPPRITLVSSEGFLKVQKRRIAKSGGQPKPVLVTSDESVRDMFAHKKVFEREGKA